MTSNELKHKAKLQEWALTVQQECRSSGNPVKQWCIENKIKVTTYYRGNGKYWELPERIETNRNVTVLPYLQNCRRQSSSIGKYRNSLQHCVLVMYQSTYIPEWTQSC